MAKKYYSVIDEAGMPLHTARNSESYKECIETIFEFWSETADDEDEEKPFEKFSFKEKENYMTSIYDIEEHEEPFPDDEDDLDDEETKAFLQEYGESYTVNDDGGRYGGYRADY